MYLYLTLPKCTKGTDHRNNNKPKNKEAIPKLSIPTGRVG